MNSIRVDLSLSVIMLVMNDIEDSLYTSSAYWLG
jgi:hypothetical protein